MSIADSDVGEVVYSADMSDAELDKLLGRMVTTS